MAFLLDTGILLRLINEDDPLHAAVEQAIDSLILRQEEFLITTQNIAELWNVATRPVVNNGLGLSGREVAKAYEDTIEPLCGVLVETDTVPDVFRRLLSQYDVVGKQVHDTRLVAIMLTWQVNSILTLNERNFLRYQPEGIAIVTPASIATANP
jgi:predicted nucleic acid-binding protein